MKGNTIGIRALAAAVTLFAVSTTITAPAVAETLTGEIGVSLIIGDGCTIGNDDDTDNANEWGTLDFGTHADVTSVIDGTVVGTDSSSAVTVTCSTGLTPTMTIDGGLYESGSLRYMSAGSTDTIAYRLYSDSARSSEVEIDGAITLTADGTAVDLPLYGRVLPADQSNTAPAAGTYEDTLVATLSW
jgi:spore coat protein U-like protein